MSLVRDKIKEHVKTYGYSRVTFDLTKDELRSLSDEERKFVEEFNDGFYRDRYRLRPESLDHFLRSPKYEGSCYVSVSIPFESLVEKGIVRTVKEGDLTYWYIYEEKLDPASYYSIYKLDPETFRTLLVTLGLAEFLDRFELKRTDVSSFTLFTLDHGDLTYRVDIWSRSATMYVSTKVIPLERAAQDHLNEVTVWFKVDDPKVEDVFKVEKRFRELADDVKERVRKIVSWIDSYVGIDPSNDAIAVSGYVDVVNYSLEKYTLSVLVHKELKRSSLEFEVDYTHPDAIEVRMRHSFGSQFLVRALQDVGLSGGTWNASVGSYGLKIDEFRRDVTVSYTGRFANISVDRLPDVSDQYHLVKHADEFLRRSIQEGMQQMAQSVIEVKGRYTSTTLDFTVKDLFNAVGWRSDQTVEEMIVKTWLIRLLALGDTTKDASVSPDVVSIANALVFLSDAPYEYVLEKSRNGFEYALNLIRRGRMKVTGQGVFIDGKPTGIDAENKYVRIVLEVLAALSNEPRGKLEEVEYRRSVLTA